MNFPQSISFTITNTCNLRCKMCAQWSEEGYMHAQKDRLKRELALSDWKRLVDELAVHQVSSVLLRGGEPCLFPGILDLIKYIHSKGIFVAIDTNGTMLKDFAADLVRLGQIHITISVDGPEEIHDFVRGVKGCFQRIRQAVEHLHVIEKATGRTISQGVCFTISPFSYRGLGAMPNVVRSLGIRTLTIVPYYYVPVYVGEAYEKELKTHFGCPAYSWRGFHHDDSGVDFAEFQQQYRAYRANLGDIYDYPYLPMTENEYRTWFTDPVTPIKSVNCSNVERLIDIQPNGSANFCVDFPDYTFGNVREATLEELWNSEAAERFRAYRREKPLPVCHRCGSKYMSETVA